jgi:hypothetical protein
MNLAEVLKRRQEAKDRRLETEYRRGDRRKERRQEKEVK